MVTAGILDPVGMMLLHDKYLWPSGLVIRFIHYIISVCNSEDIVHFLLSFSLIVTTKAFK